MALLGQINTCLTDYIGIEGCTPGTTPESGLYINQLEGLELKMIDQIANEQQSDYLGVWADVQKRAITMMGHDVRQMLNRRFRLKTITQSAEIGKKIDTTSVTAALAQLRGVTLELNYEGDDYTGSNLHSIHIQYIYIYSDYAGSVPIYVYDLDLGTIAGTFTSTLAVGWNTVNVNTSFAGSRLFVCYNATNVNSVELNLSKIKDAINYGSPQSDWYCSFDYSEVCCGVKIKGATAAPGTPTTLTEGLNSYGLSAVFSVNCTWDTFICNNRNIFANAFMYCLGIELMSERIYSSRLNEFTVFDRDKAYELRKLYTVKYKGGIMDEIPYQGLLTQAVEGVNMNQYDCCIEPNADFNFRDSLL